MPMALHPRRRLALGFCTAGILVVGTLLALVAVDRWHSHQAVVATAERTTQNLARTLEEHAARTITTADLVLSAVVYNFSLSTGGLGQSRGLAKSLASRQSSNGIFSDIEVLDATGDRVGAVAPANAPLHFADQDYFVAHRDSPDIGLYISAPYVSRLSNTWSIALSRRLSNADQSFAGVIFAVIDLKYFQNFYATVDVGPAGNVTLWSAAGTRVLLRQPANRYLLEQVFDEGSLFEALAGGRTEGTIASSSPVDAVKRVISYRRVGDLPFVVSVGLADDDYLATWRADTLRYALATLIIACIIIVLTVVLHRQWARRQTTEARLRDFASVGSDWFWETDADHRFTAITHAVQRVLEHPLENRIGQRRWSKPELLTPEGAHAIEQLRALHESRLPFKSYIYAWRSADGPRYVQISGCPLFGADGQFIGYRGIGADITERKRQEIEISRSRSLLQTVIDALPARISVKDRSLRYVLVNLAQAAEFGCPPEAAIGKRKHDFDIADASAEAGRSFVDDLHSRDHRVLTSGTSILNYEETLPQRNGAVKNSLSSKIPLRDEDGQVFAVLTVAIDISERKRIETELLAAREAAEQASRTKSQFLANMSHELRTPLNAVIGFSDVMKAQLFGPLGDSRYAGYASDICESGQHLLSIINDILDLAKVESGKLDLNEEAVDIDLIAAGCGKLVRQRAIDAGIQLTIFPAPDMPLIRADEIRMKQVLLNLLSNAVKFTPRGGRVTFSVGRDRDDGVVLKVADTGIGMSEEHIELALRPFGQIDSSLARKHGGTGLGLPLARTLVEMQDGRLEVASEIGKGTMVSVIIGKHRLVPREHRRAPDSAAKPRWAV
jgi:PAS domain S-box-containing protein